MEKEGECHQVRLTQQKETKHFLAIFPTFAVHLGKFINYKEVKAEILDIRAIEDFNKKNSYFYRAVGCSVSLAMSESKSSCLQLHIGVNDDPKTVILFVNESSLENPVLLTDGVQFAKSILKTAAYPKLNNNCKIVFVDSKKNLRNNLIDIESKLQSKIADGSLKVRTKRLFQIMARTGVVESAEILDFCQDDLDARDCFLLDCFDHVICWVGFYATFPLKRVVMETVASYGKIRNLNLHEQVFVVKQFGEPIEWRSEFQGWGEYKVKFRQKLDERLLTLDEVLQDYSRKTYTYAELLGDKLPVGVDESKLETYLSNEEFQEVFKMSRAEFEKMPKYKAQELKKKNCLF